MIFFRFRVFLVFLVIFVVLINVSSTNSEQCKLCVNDPLHIDARLLWEQIMGSNCPE